MVIINDMIISDIIVSQSTVMNIRNVTDLKIKKLRVDNVKFAYSRLFNLVNVTRVSIDELEFIKVSHNVQGETFVNIEQVEQMNLTNVKFVECSKEGVDSSVAVTA